MNWESEEIQKVLCVERTLRQGQITVLEFDRVQRVGVGHISQDGLALILPAQEGVSSINDRYLTFMPSVDLETDANQEFKNVALVSCSFGETADGEIAAVSSVFSALIKQALHSRDTSAAGKTVHALRRLFDNRLKFEVSRETEIGLLGELLVISSSQSRERIVEAWHTSNSDPYDFSRDSERIEVKSTTSSDRKHSFSSNQLPPVDGISLLVCSVLLVAVAKGETVASIYRRILGQLESPILRERFTSICLDVLGVPPELIEHLQIDEMSSLNNIAFYAPDELPQPILVPGIESCRWIARLSEVATSGLIPALYS
jgi:hypothetical protein